MSGAVPLLPLYTCVAWTGTALPFTETQLLLQSGYRKADHAVSDLAVARQSYSDLGGLTVDVLRSHTVKRARGGVMVKVLRYKPAGRGFDSR